MPNAALLELFGNHHQLQIHYHGILMNECVVDTELSVLMFVLTIVDTQSCHLILFSGTDLCPKGTVSNETFSLVVDIFGQVDLQTFWNHLPTWGHWCSVVMTKRMKDTHQPHF